MGNSVYKLFNRGIKWNALEGIIYQSVLTLHQLVLFSITTNFFYGVTGILFSVLYLSILFFNFGFDKSLAAFFHIFTQNKSSFKKIYLSQFLIQLLVLSFIFFTVFLFANQIVYKFFSKLISDLDVLVILALLLLTESLKKSLRYLCELAFLNKFIALTEIFLILFYVTSFWGGYFYLKNVTLYLVFVPHLIQSIIGVFVFSYFAITKIYKKLPNNAENHLSVKTIKNILINRLSNYLNQLSHLLFSGNFLIPFLSIIYGIEKISVFKLLNIISVYFTVILERTFGLTSGALLSHLQELSQSVKQKALNVATNKLMIALYAVFILFFFNFKNVFNASFKVTTLSWFSVYLFLFAILFENFFITMEQFFIVESKIYYFVFINLLAALSFYSITSLTFFVSLPLEITLSYLIIIRIISFLVLRLILKKKFNINLDYKISVNYIIYFIISAVLILLFVKYILINLLNLFKL